MTIPIISEIIKVICVWTLETIKNPGEHRQTKSCNQSNKDEDVIPFDLASKKPYSQINCKLFYLSQKRLKFDNSN